MNSRDNTAISMFWEILNAVRIRVFELLGESHLVKAEELLPLHLTIRDAGECCSELIDHLHSYALETQTGMRIHHIHSAGVRLNRLGILFSKLSAWSTNEHGIIETTYFIHLDKPEFLSYKKIPQLDNHINNVRTQIEAVSSPSPERLPSQEVIQEVVLPYELLMDNINKIQKSIESYIAEQKLDKEYLHAYCPKCRRKIGVFSSKAVTKVQAVCPHPDCKAGVMVFGAKITVEGTNSQQVETVTTNLINEVYMKTRTSRSRNPWISGSFYLAGAVILGALVLVMARVIGAFMLPIVIIGTLLLVSIVGAFQLRQDEMLSQKNFLSLMLMTFTQIPFLRKTENRGTKGKK